MLHPLLEAAATDAAAVTLDLDHLHDGAGLVGCRVGRRGEDRGALDSAVAGVSHFQRRCHADSEVDRRRLRRDVDACVAGSLVAPQEAALAVRVAETV